MKEMETKQLNFSAPLLSARRYSSPLRSSGEEARKETLPERRHSFPAKNSDVKMGEVVKPGSVPFMWEQIPGRAKVGANSQVHSPEEPANTPRLPPGRALGPLPRVSGVKSGELSFLRPQNKLSGELNLIRPQHKLSGELNFVRPPTVPTKFLSGELAVVRAQNRLPSFSFNDNVRSIQVNEAANQKAHGFCSDTDDAAFSDALDALESYSVNCSTSALSASELPITKPSGNSSTDVGNLDFMMNRFLPAAKAMTLESPQHASKRQIVAVEQPQLPKVIVPKIVKGPYPAPVKNMTITLYTGQDIGSEQSEDDEAERSDEPRNLSVKSCGFFPWFCSKNALRLLNPVPAMKVKTKSAFASASKVGRLVKNASYKSPRRTNSKHAPSTQHMHKVNPVTKSCELNRIKTKHLPESKSRPMFYSGELPRNRDSQARNNNLSPYRNYRRSTVSPYRNESPQSPFHNGIGYLIVPKTVEQPDDYRSKPNDRSSNISGPMSFNHRKMQGSRPGSPVTERTLYVDSVNIIRSRQSSGRIDMKARGIAKPSTHGTVDANLASFSSIEAQMDHSLSKLNQSFQPSKVLGNGYVNTSREIVLRTDPAVQSPLPPPLPKSPSESWLSRNLNAVSPRNSVSHTHASTKFQLRQHTAQTPTNASTKWETIVKSSHLHYDHGRYSEELVARVPQQSQRRK